MALQHCPGVGERGRFSPLLSGHQMLATLGIEFLGQVVLSQLKAILREGSAESCLLPKLLEAGGRRGSVLEGGSISLAVEGSTLCIRDQSWWDGIFANSESHFEHIVH